MNGLMGRLGPSNATYITCPVDLGPKKLPGAVQLIIRGTVDESGDSFQKEIAIIDGSDRKVRKSLVVHGVNGLKLCTR
jgi:hypothetical protein